MGMGPEKEKTQDLNQILTRLVQVGTVTDIDLDKCRARVLFQNTGITSAWLYVLDAHNHIPDFDPEPQRTEYEAGGSGDSAFESHAHDLVIKQWMPHINDTVVVLYLPVFNSDGFVLGRVPQ